MSHWSIILKKKTYNNIVVSKKHLWYFLFPGGSSNGSDPLKDNVGGHSSASDSDLTSLGPRSAPPHGGGASGNGNGSSNGSERSSGTQVAAGGKDIAGSRQSFKIAMGNPCEMFVDVM